MATAVAHSYTYAFSSGLDDESVGHRLRLATSGGAEQFPYFFQGALIKPRLTALLLRALSKVVASRFHMPAIMLRRIIAERDPVVTSGGGMLRFEGFSGCCSAYARVDLTPDAYHGVIEGQGTTNVDFNQEMRSALAQVRDHESVGLAIGTDEVALLRGSEQVVERKVKLPVRWIKGFVEVQAYQSRMERRVAVGMVEALQFFRSLPKSAIGKAACWVTPAGRRLRLSQRESPEGIKLAGLERLRVMEDLVPLSQGLTIFSDPAGEASEWVLHFGPLNLHLTITADIWRGFSGEGQVLSDLAAFPENCNRALELIRGTLKWQAELRADEFSANWDVKSTAIRQALSILGSRGLVGFDLARNAYYHRELPFDLTLVEELHPRLKAARQLIKEGGVQILRTDAETESAEVEVRGTDVVHRVRIADSVDRCTCPWFARHQGARGPCKHILAAQILLHPDESIDS